MATTSPTPVLTDDHIDLLITAAADWRLLASPTAAAFAQSALERHVIVASSTEAGRMLRAENTASVRWLSDPVSYTHLDVYKRQLGGREGRPAPSDPRRCRRRAGRTAASDPRRGDPRRRGHSGQLGPPRDRPPP